MPTAAQGIAQSKDDGGRQKHLCVGQERFKLGDEKDESTDEHQTTNHGQGYRVDERADDFTAELIQTFEEVRHALQNIMKEAGPLASLHHGGLQGRKHLGEEAESFGQGAAIGNGGAYFFEELAQVLVATAANEAVERLEQRHSAAQKVRELPVHDADIFGFDSAVSG